MGFGTDKVTWPDSAISINVHVDPQRSALGDSPQMDPDLETLLAVRRHHEAQSRPHPRFHRRRSPNLDTNATSFVERSPRWGPQVHRNALHLSNLEGLA